MPDKARPQVIAIEEHYLDAEVDAKLHGRVGGGPETRKRLADLGELRLKEMDAAGIDIQVLSHCPPGAQAFDAETAASQAEGVNDRLIEVVRSKPNRFAAFGHAWQPPIPGPPRTSSSAASTSWASRAPWCTD